ncbi:MAG: hypothetical protein E7394_05815 [Ruminococcaceae bacterium]|nr:hypothetical protein [Oscillospiraceae bacterium]
MKQNTKFLWMYIAILFSFALILIVFAGLSRNSDIEQKEGLQGDVRKLSEKNLELTNEINTLNATIIRLNDQIVTISGENANYKMISDNENLLVQAKEAEKSGDEEKCDEILNSINTQTLTQSQLLMYESLK